MGKKRITVIGEEKIEKKAMPTGRQERQIAQSGKQHGRITDMGALALEEAEKVAQKSAESVEPDQDQRKSAKDQRKPASKQKVRGQRFLAARKQVDRAKFYPLNEAISLAKKTSISKFKGNLELHLILKEAGLKKEIALPHPLTKDKPKIMVETEKKLPLIHLVIGKPEMTDEQLATNFQAVIRVIGLKNLKKAVLTSTMGPGVKVALTN